MIIPNIIKKKILNDWSNEFPELSAYSQNKLYKVIGLFITGIEIVKLPRTDDYRPHFVCYPLWKFKERECLDEPIIFQEILNNRGFQFNIPYMKHDIYFKEAVECTRKQIILSFNENLNLSSLFKVINNQFSKTLIKSSPVQQGKLYEFKLFAAFYVNNSIAVNNVIVEINQASQNWVPDLFEWKFGKIDEWILGLKNTIGSKEEFLIQIEENKRVEKIEMLKSSELIA